MYENKIIGSMLTGVIPPPCGKSTIFIKDKTNATAKHIAAKDIERTSKSGFLESTFCSSPVLVFFFFIKIIHKVITKAKAITTHKITNQFSIMSSQSAGLLPLKNTSNILPIKTFILFITNLSNILFTDQECVNKKVREIPVKIPPVRIRLNCLSPIPALELPKSGSKGRRSMSSSQPALQAPRTLFNYSFILALQNTAVKR